MANGQALFPPLRSKYLSKYLFLSPSLKVSSWKHRAPLITSEEEPRPIFPKPWARAHYPWKKSLTRANASLRGKTIGKAYCSPCHNTSPTLNHFQVLKQCLCPPCPFSGWNRKELHFIWSCLETTHTTCLPWKTEVLFNLPQMNPLRCSINNLYFEQSQDHNAHGSVRVGGCFHYYPWGAKQVSIFSPKINLSRRILVSSQ